MQPREPQRLDWRIGWIALAVALVAVLILAVDIARKHSADIGSDTKTRGTAQGAGASVAPTDPKLPPSTK